MISIRKRDVNHPRAMRLLSNYLLRHLKLLLGPLFLWIVLREVLLLKFSNGGRLILGQVIRLGIDVLPLLVVENCPFLFEFVENAGRRIRL